MKLVGSSAFEQASGLKFVDASDIDDPALDQFDFVPVNLPLEVFCTFPDLRNRAVMIVGNGEVSNYGFEIDQTDCVIRINSMYNWQEEPQHDGRKITIWAGLPGFAVTPKSATTAQWETSRFARIAPTLDLIWCVSPYQCSARAYRWLQSEGLLSKFCSTPDPLAVLDDCIGRLPAPFASRLFSMPVLYNGVTGITNFELLLTGVKTALLTYLSGAREIHLCGFDFFQSRPGAMWSGHDRALNLDVLRFVRDSCHNEKLIFSWREQRSIGL